MISHSDVTPNSVDNPIHKKRGLVISFEGIDGSGKGTQAGLLKDSLNKLGLKAILTSYPRYDKPIGALIGKMLNGDYGDGVPDALAKDLFKYDRIDGNKAALEAVEAGYIQLFDRYSDSNTAHQGGKLATKAERLEFIHNQYQDEFIDGGLLIPDKTILLDTPVPIAIDNILKKRQRQYTSKKQDKYEGDIVHLQSARVTYMLLAREALDRFIVINTISTQQYVMRSEEDIHTEIMSRLQPLLDKISR